MISAPTVALWLDTRSINKEGKAPLKLRITYQRTTKRYELKKFMNQAVFMDLKEYDEIIKMRHRTKFLPYNKMIVELQDKVKTINPFSFEAFEKALFKKEIQKSDDLIDLYIESINGFKKDQVSSIDTYVNAIKKLCKYKFGNDEVVLSKNSENLYYKATTRSFKISEVNALFLENFSRTVTESDIAKSTVSIYLRTLRAVYNKAIASGIVTKESYPFLSKNNKPVITVEKKAQKTVLSANQIKEIMKLELYSNGDEFGRDFWLLSFFCYGLNITDLLHLRVKDFYSDNNYFQFVRRKTKNKVNEVIKVMVIPIAKEIINKYKTGIKPDDLVFNFLEGYETPDKIKGKEKWVVKRINRGMKNIADRIGKNSIKTYDCRYTFANLSRNKNVPFNFIKYAMGHTIAKRITDTYMIEYNDDEIKYHTESIFADFL